MNPIVSTTLQRLMARRPAVPGRPLRKAELPSRSLPPRRRDPDGALPALYRSEAFAEDLLPPHGSD